MNPLPDNSTSSLTAQAPLGQLLLRKGVLSQDQLDSALEQQKNCDERKLIGEVLVEMGLADNRTVLETLAQAYGIPFASDTARLADPKVIEVLPREFLQEHGVLPMFLVRDVLTVAVSEPANLYLLEEIERRTGYTTQIVAATSDDIESAHQSYLPAANVFVIDEIYEDIDEHDFAVIEQDATELADLEEDAGHGPVVKLVNFLIYSAVQEGASDIHIEPDDRMLRVRYRVDGKLYEKYNRLIKCSKQLRAESRLWQTSIFQNVVFRKMATSMS